MTTLVTGALGCVGSWVVRSLLAAGEQAVLYDVADDPWRLRMIAGTDVIGRVTIVQGDIISHLEPPIPFPHALDDARYQRDLGAGPSTSLADGVPRTLEEFRRLEEERRLDARELA